MDFIVGNKYEMIYYGDKTIMQYLGKKPCKINEDSLWGTSIIPDDFDIEEPNKGRIKIDIKNIKCTEYYSFNDITYGEEPDYINEINIIISDTEKLKKIKNYMPIDFTSLSNIGVDINQIEQSSITTLKELFVKTYPNYPPDRNQDKVFHEYSSAIKNHNFRLNYISVDGNTFIESGDSSNYKFRESNRNLLRVLNTTPKAESDFYVFRGTFERDGYEPGKIISRTVTEENIFGSISTTIFSRFSRDWIGKHNPCCMYLIRVPKEENYLILDDVFTKTNGELVLNDKSQYEVTLAPGKITFTYIKKIIIDGSELVLFVCDYKSFTEEDFVEGFYNPIFNIKYSKKYPIEYK